MQFSFKLSWQDSKPFMKVANRRLTAIAKANPKLFVAYLVAWIPIGFAVAAYAAMYSEYPELTHDLNVVAVAVVVGAVLLVASNVFKQFLYQGASIAENGAFLVTQTVDADAKTICFSSSFGTHTYPWDCFIHRAEDAGHIYLFIDNAMALIIPKRFIDSPEKLAELRRWAGLGEP